MAVAVVGRWWWEGGGGMGGLGVRLRRRRLWRRNPSRRRRRRRRRRFEKTREALTDKVRSCCSVCVCVRARFTVAAALVLAVVPRATTRQ